MEQFPQSHSTVATAMPQGSMPVGIRAATVFVAVSIAATSLFLPTVT